MMNVREPLACFPAREFRKLVCVFLLTGYFLANSADTPLTPPPRNYTFDGTLSREVLENYLSRSISMEGLFNGRGDFDDNVRMLKSCGAKFIGRSLCLWGGEGNLLRNLERAKSLVPEIALRGRSEDDSSELAFLKS